MDYLHNRSWGVNVVARQRSTEPSSTDRTKPATGEASVWAEELPRNCPPSEAYEPEDSDCFRFVSTDPPSHTDFLSNRALYPNRQFGVSECQARALSILDDLSVAFKRLQKLPLQRGKLVAHLSLPPEAGLILQTGRHNQHHYSWWLRADFDPIPICTIVEADTWHGEGDE